jgi:hypothetical protein
MDSSSDEFASNMIKYNGMNQATRHGIVTPMAQDEIAVLGASLRQINQRLLTPAKEHGTTRVWYQGGEAYFDVFAELRQGEIDWFQFTLRGKSLSWSAQSSRWQTGRTNELRTDDITFYPASKLIESDYQLDWEFIKLTYAILQTRVGDEIFDKMLAVFDAQVSPH